MKSSGTLIGLVGCGRWGQHILRDLKSLNCRVAVMATSERTAHNAQAGGADLIVPSLKELAMLVDLKGVVVAAPSDKHYRVLKSLIELRPNLPIFCEKPITCSSAHAGELLQLQSDQIFVMDKWRYHPGILKLAEFARTQTLGQVIGLRTERLGWGSPHNDSNSVWHLFPHDLSIVLEILGMIPEVIFAHVEKFEGTIVGVRSILGRQPWIYCDVSTHWPVRIRRVQLVCAQGVAVLEDGYSTIIKVARGPLNQGDRAPEIEEIEVGSAMPLLTELGAFMDYLCGRAGRPKSSLQEGLRIVETIEKTLLVGEQNG